MEELEEEHKMRQEEKNWRGVEGIIRKTGRFVVSHLACDYKTARNENRGFVFTRLLFTRKAGGSIRVHGGRYFNY